MADSNFMHVSFAGAAAAANDSATSRWLAAPIERLWAQVERVSPAVGNHPGITLSVVAAATASGAAYYGRQASVWTPTSLSTMIMRI